MEQYEGTTGLGSRGDLFLSVQNFLSNSDLINISMRERICAIQQMTFDGFISFVTDLNAAVQGLPLHKAGEWTVPGLRITDPQDTTGLIVNYFVPSNGKQFLQEFFEEMKKNISEDNIGDYAIRLRYAIVFSHIFSDGNGRTSRCMQSLISTGCITENNFVSESSSNNNPNDINTLATWELFQEYDVGNTIKNPEEMLYLSFLFSERMVDMGFATSLKILALFRTFPKKEIRDFIVSNGNEIYRGMFDSERQTYENHYRILQKELFDKVQEILTRKNQGVVNMVDIKRFLQENLSALGL